MKNCYIIIVLVLVQWTLGIAQNAFLFSNQETPVALLRIKKEAWVVTENTIYILQNNRLKRSISLPQKTLSATQRDNVVYLGTEKGLKTYALPNGPMQDFVIPDIATNPKVNKVAVDERGSIWVATPYFGTFEIKNNQILLRSQIAPAYSVASTPGNIWVGTNLGLYQLSLKEDKWTRYAEEGVSGYEIPDNYVEKLFPDESGNLWIGMPESVAYIPNSSAGSQADFDYIGSRDNELYAICHIPKQAYLLATSQGVVALTERIEAHEQGTDEEILSHAKTTARQLSATQLGAPATLQKEPVLLMIADKKYTWFLTAKGVWNTSAKALAKQLAPMVETKK